MSSISLERTDVIVGVDTHKDEHVAVVIDGLGGRLGEYYVSVTSSGYAELLAWAKTFGRVHAFGVEGTGSYGMGLGQVLTAPRRDGDRSQPATSSRATPPRR